MSQNCRFERPNVLETCIALKLHEITNYFIKSHCKDRRRTSVPLFALLYSQRLIKVPFVVFYKKHAEARTGLWPKGAPGTVLPLKNLIPPERKKYCGVNISRPLKIFSPPKSYLVSFSNLSGTRRGHAL